MIKNYSLCLVMMVSISLFSQRYEGNTVLPDTDIEFRAFSKYYASASSCKRRLEVRFITPTLRSDFDINDTSSIGSTYKVELYNSFNQLLSTKIFQPSDYTDKNDINWYRYITSFTSIGSGVSYYVKVSLIYNFFVTLNYGGFLQEPEAFAYLVSSARNSSIRPCQGNGGNTGQPNLDITRINIRNGSGTSYNPLSNQTPTLNRNQTFNISFDVKNAGSRTSNPTDARFLVGTSSNKGSASEFGTYIAIPARNGGSTRSFSQNIFIPSNDLLGALKLSAGQKYYMFIVVDETNINDESNETDNIEKFQFTYSTNTSKGDCIICPIGFDELGLSTSAKANLGTTSKTMEYQIDIFDFTGQKVLTRQVNSIEEENRIIGDLPKNIYIIKSKNGDRKVYQ